MWQLSHLTVAGGLALSDEAAGRRSEFAAFKRTSAFPEQPAARVGAAGPPLCYCRAMAMWIASSGETR